MKHNIRITGILEGEEKELGRENLFEKLMTENFPNLEREKATQVQEAQKVPIKMNPKKSIPRHVVIKMPSIKDKEKILKAAREKEEVTYNAALIRVAADFST